MGLLNFDDPNEAGMMGLASGLLGASGFSRMPVSLGQALAAGVENSQKSYSAAQAERRANMAYKLQELQLQQQLRQQALLDPIYKQIGEQMGGQVPSTPVADNSPTPAGLSPISASAFGAPELATPDVPKPVSQAPRSGTAFGVPTSVLGPMIALGGPAKAAEAIMSYNKPTDLQLNMRAARTDPLMADWAKKETYIAPTPLRTDKYIGADGQLHFAPGAAPEGFMYRVDPTNPSGYSLVEVGKGTQAIQATAEAKASGKAAVTPQKVWNPTTGQYEWSNELAVTKGQNPPVSPQDQRAIDAWKASNAQAPGQPFSVKAQTEPAPSGNAVAEAPPGTEKGAETRQSNLSASWQKLSDQNREANNTVSYLQSIKQQATKAITGPMSDKLQYANSVLALVGNEKALDTKTANDLLDKYSNQIVARLGQGGLGTDAARAILQSAYPNSHMTQEAIHEAADNLIGASRMVQAKTKLLSGYYVKGDVKAYTNAETTFDNNADPRIFQMEEMPAQSRAAFVKSLPAPVAAQLLKQRQALKSLGVL